MSKWLTLLGFLILLSACEGDSSEVDPPDDNNPPNDGLPSTLVLNLAEIDQDTLLIEWNRPSKIHGHVNYTIYSGSAKLYEISSEQETVSLRVSPIPSIGEISVRASQEDMEMTLRESDDRYSGQQ